ncbi:hypothetical protein K438DRAFT_894181 [Mycena galopus ATCC 62051]|nr:hypothetical protein K438DRAFT_894181 [Mycena galopus ATCC 62051]
MGGEKWWCRYRDGRLAQFPTRTVLGMPSIPPALPLCLSSYLHSICMPRYFPRCKQYLEGVGCQHCIATCFESCLSPFCECRPPRLSSRFILLPLRRLYPLFFNHQHRFRRYLPHLVCCIPESLHHCCLVSRFRICHQSSLELVLGVAYSSTFRRHCFSHFFVGPNRASRTKVVSAAESSECIVETTLITMWGSRSRSSLGGRQRKPAMSRCRQKAS